MPCTKYTSLTNEIYLFCTCFTSQSALWLNTDGVASFEITAGEQNHLPMYFRINISGFHLHEERKINKNHLPGTFTYFPTVQNCPNGNFQKYRKTCQYEPLEPGGTVYTKLSVGYQEKDAPLISGFKNVIFLIWLEECIHVIIIISSLTTCIGGSSVMVLSCRKSWGRGAWLRRRGLCSRRTVGRPSEKWFCPVCVITAGLVHKQFMRFEEDFNANIGQHLRHLSLSKKLKLDGEND